MTTLPPPPASALTIVTKQPMAGAFISPRGEVNGYPVGLRWGSNIINVPPGVHHVKIYMPWLWRFGQAEVTVDNRSQPAPPIHYASPYLNFGSGAIGFAPVKNPGLGAFIALLGIPLLALCACLGAAFLFE